MNKVVRPFMKKTKISSKNEFELCYLRHRYFRKANFNPTKEDMDPYLDIIKQSTFNTYYKNLPLFKSIGLEQEDIKNINLVHLTSFLGLFSLERQKDKMSSFIATYTDKHQYPPESTDILTKNKANFSLFLSQRMIDMVRICRQKIKNIKGLTNNICCCYEGSQDPPKDMNRLLSDFKDYDYKPISYDRFNEIKKQANKRSINSFKHEGKWYVQILLNRLNQGEHDPNDSYEVDSFDYTCSKTPEMILSDKEDGDCFREKVTLFFNNSKEKQADTLKAFIINNMKNDKLKEEIMIAKQYLKKIEVK